MADNEIAPGKAPSKAVKNTIGAWKNNKVSPP